MKRKLNDRDFPEPASGRPVRNVTEESARVTSFAALGLDTRLLQALSREKLSRPTAVQASAVPVILSGKDVRIRAKTGSGKTVAYVLPALHSLLNRASSKHAKKPHSKTLEILLLVPTKELAAQVSSTLKRFLLFCGGEIRTENLSREEDDAVTRAKLVEQPDIVVATPKKALLWTERGDLKLQTTRLLVLDEADLFMSYGYESDLRSLAEALPKEVQFAMISATLRAEVDTISSIFGRSSSPEVLDFSQAEAEEKPTLAHYVVRTAEEDKFLLAYAIFKLQLIKGKIIIFVADVDRAYRLKLFLERFGVRACTLNSELPVNSRLHVVEEFNRGAYDIIIAADESDIIETRPHANEESDLNGGGNEYLETSGLGDKVGNERESANADKPIGKPPKPVTSRKMTKRNRREDPEYGVSRGIDFRAVTCVLNFDLPTSSKSYIHRAGRTARAGQTGMALSFYVPKTLYRKHKSTSIPQCENDEEVLSKIRKNFTQPQTDIDTPSNTEEIYGSENNQGLQEWAVDWDKLEGLRYRFADALRSVTRIAVREARTRELRQELINSEKLKRHFEENPDDLRHLRHDRETRVGRQLSHLKHVPEYLLPNGAQAALGNDVGFVGLHKVKDNRIRKARMFKKGKGKLKGAKGKALDPLRTLNIKGRGEK